MDLQMKKYYMGIDVGSLSTDGVIVDENGIMSGSIILPTGASILKTIALCREQLSDICGVPQELIVKTASTGYGRRKVDYAGEIITEITAHALGAHHWAPETRTVIDIGGQDTKVIKLDYRGRVADFAMNDKCAAGTGRFIEVMARLLETDLDGLAEMACNAEDAADITSTCTVFIESEIISLISENSKLETIAAGVFQSIAGRIKAMVSGVGGVPPFTLTGGVAKNRGMVAALKKILPGSVYVPEEPQIAGAYGAAIYVSGRKEIRD